MRIKILKEGINKLNKEMENALGCLVGVLVGDAAGAPLEFRGSIKDDQVKNAIRMCGGGTIGIGKGQITDDGELTMGLANTLVGNAYYPYNEVAKCYSQWIDSNPFDCGSTCMKAFGIQKANREAVGKNYVGALLYNAAKYNQFSEANGALMRVSPIAIWAHNEPYQVIASYAKFDAQLSHPNQVCCDCNASYAIALAALIKTDGDHEKAFEITKDYVDTACSNSNSNSKVRHWFYKERMDYLDGEDNNLARCNIGHVKHAWCMAMNFLEKPVDYETGIRQVLKMGGDTDTNAAICGGILGAINGYNSIPEFMKEPVLNYEYKVEDSVGYPRPVRFTTKNVLDVCNNLFFDT